MKTVLVFTQGDPAGVGPELLLKLLSGDGAARPWRALVVAEGSALEVHARSLAAVGLERFVELGGSFTRVDLEHLGEGEVALVDPGCESREIVPGSPTAADARAAMQALDRGVELVTSGLGDALITAPLNKEEISHHCRSDFRGHTDYLAASAGLGSYGEDYLMSFLTPDLQVALLTTHVPLRQALATIDRPAIVAALRCLQRHAGGRIAVAGLNPHAGEGGLLGDEEIRFLGPAVEEARCLGVDAYGPFSPDSIFARARRGEFDWVLALYHDQGLVAVKTVAFGASTNWTLGLPFVRTSVDHGTAYDIAGSGQADSEPLCNVVQTTLQLLQAKLPRRAAKRVLVRR